MVSIQNIFSSIAFAVLAQSAVIPNDTSLLNQTNSTGFVTLDFDVVRKPLNSTAIAQHPIKRRSIPLQLSNDGTQYLAKLTVGSNKQSNTVIVDTGSSDLWFIDSNAKCEGEDNNCKASGSSGTWGKDTVGIGSVSIKQQFGEVSDTSVEERILGIGFTASEFSDTKYPNVPVTLKTYKTGTIIFGGLDTAKYSGKLIAETITRNTDLTIELNSLNYNGQTVSINQDALPDSGTTLTYLPANVVKSLAKKAGATSETDSDGNVTWHVPCKSSTSGNAVFSFPNGAQITVPLSEFVIDEGDGTCNWGIQQADDIILLGDNFLRHAYTVFNIDAKTISIAQVKYSTTSNIVSI
ncbi:unnamed protein product [Candida verbasci]|uniref:candidapepsin n=1 Tax=Candida verbasci TaxID=1227364 RepID=A0A9W4X8R1_9ASCO|nr:unnamed protein product [Candida verbasci]